MPPLSHLALRYMTWFIALRVLLGLLVQYAGFPASMATGVILAALPMTDIGMQAARRATRDLRLADWALVWGVCLAVVVTLQVILPAIFLPPMRAAFSDPAALRQIAIILLSTGAMMALFLFIGRGAARGPAR